MNDNYCFWDFIDGYESCLNSINAALPRSGEEDSITMLNAILLSLHLERQNINDMKDRVFTDQVVEEMLEDEFEICDKDCPYLWEDDEEGYIEPDEKELSEEEQETLDEVCDELEAYLAKQGFTIYRI